MQHKPLRAAGITAALIAFWSIDSVIVSGSQPALAACVVTGAAPVTVACGTTTTTNTTNSISPNAASVDRQQEFGDDISGSVTNGATIDGFGLNLKTDKIGGAISMDNNGAVTTANAVTAALQLDGNGGLVTYMSSLGTGTVSNTGTGAALGLSNTLGGEITATVNNSIQAAQGAGLTTQGATGIVQVTVTAAGTVQSNQSDAMEFFGNGTNALMNSGTVRGVGAIRSVSAPRRSRSPARATA